MTLTDNAICDVVTGTVDVEDTPEDRSWHLIISKSQLLGLFYLWQCVYQIGSPTHFYHFYLWIACVEEKAVRVTPNAKHWDLTYHLLFKILSRIKRKYVIILIHGMIYDSVFHSIVVVTIIIIQYVSGFALSRLVCLVEWAMIREISRDWPSQNRHHQNNRKVQLIFYNCGSKLVPSWSWSVSWSPGEAASPGSKGSWFETTDHHRGWREVKPREPRGEMTIKIYSFLFSQTLI